MSTDLEDQLRRTLDRHADEITAGLHLEDIRSRARDLRRQSHRRWATGLAAAAVVLIAVPAAVLLPGHDDSAPVAPTPTPTVAPDKLPSPSADSTAGSESPLSGLRVGAAPNWPYLHAGRVQLPEGATVPLPGSDGAVSAFASFKGGWLVADDDTARTTWYDAGGQVVEAGRGLSIVTSDDGTRVAFLMDGRVRLSGRSSMGEGAPRSLPARGVLDGLAGFVRGGLVVTTNGGDVQLFAPDGATDSLPGVYPATATSESANLVGGFTGPETGGVVDLTSGRLLWQKGWRPLAFSPDGRYLAATPARDNGDASELAILEARTGTTVARIPLTTNGMHLRGTPVWEDGKHLLFIADAGPDAHEAILRMGVDSGVERASPIADGGLDATRPAAYVLAAGR